MADLPDAEKAFTDCSAIIVDKKGFKDMPTCIADLEGLLPTAEKIIADLKAGNT